jgi:hypothetical protein
VIGRLDNHSSEPERIDDKTATELKVIAALAIIGLSKIPHNG